jgi:uncharacterized membrane protein YfcA
MDDVWLHYALFLIATFAASLVAGLSGFAFGLIAAAVWLHFLTPIQTATLIIAFGLLVQGISVWKLRHALDWRRLWPFVLGAAIGVPLGVAILDWADARQVQIGVGAFLVLYGIYSLARPTLGPVRCGGAVLDCGVGFLNGVLAGVTGLAGILVVIWCGLRGWPKDVQRGVLGAKGAIATDTLMLFLIGLPVLLAGTWLGLKLYGRIEEAGFRRIVLVLLLLSGLLLVVPSLRW